MFAPRLDPTKRPNATPPTPQRRPQDVGPGSYTPNGSRPVNPATVPFHTQRERMLMENTTTSATTPGAYAGGALEMSMGGEPGGEGVWGVERRCSGGARVALKPVLWLR
jgi:hypothetical protein